MRNRNGMPGKNKIQIPLAALQAAQKLERAKQLEKVPVQIRVLGELSTLRGEVALSLENAERALATVKARPENFHPGHEASLEKYARIIRRTLECVDVNIAFTTYVAAPILAEEIEKIATRANELGAGLSEALKRAETEAPSETQSPPAPQLETPPTGP